MREYHAGKSVNSVIVDNAMREYHAGTPSISRKLGRLDIAPVKDACEG